MNQPIITRENLPHRVELAIRQTRSMLDDATRRADADQRLVRDLEVAIKALQLIDSELKSGNRRPKAQRSGSFTRYCVDEERNMVMDVSLRDTVVKIEQAYKRL